MENIKLSKAPKEQKTPSLATIDEFLAQTKSVYVKAGESVEIPIEYIPLLNCQKQCFVIISNEQIGDFVSQINASGTLDTRTANNLDDEEVLFWKCHIGEKNKIRIKMDLRNQKLVHAVQKLAKYQMSQGTVYFLTGPKSTRSRFEVPNLEPGPKWAQVCHEFHILHSKSISLK